MRNMTLVLIYSAPLSEFYGQHWGRLPEIALGVAGRIKVGTVSSSLLL